MKRKTITVNRKRYRKNKPSDLYVAEVVRYDSICDQDGDEINHDSTIEVEMHALSLKDVMSLIEDNSCTDDSDVNELSAWFESELQQDYSNSTEAEFHESRTTVYVHATKSRLDRLDRIVNPAKFERRKRWEAERAERERMEVEAQSRRRAFKVIDGAAAYNGLPSRKSQARLKLVS